MTTYSDKRFTELLKDTGQLLISDPSNGSPLRNLVSEIEQWQYTDIEDSTRLTIYTLCLFTQDFFYNLTGDIPFYQDVTECQHRVLRSTGEDLLQLADRVNNSGCRNCEEVLGRIVSQFLTTIADLNKGRGSKK